MAGFYTDMNKYTDAHCHLLSPDIPDNIWAITNGTGPADWDAVIKVSAQNPNVAAAIGVHPWHVTELPDNWYALLRDLLIENPGVMVGEAGLDKYHPDMSQQLEVFTRQLELAHELGRGMHVHCVGAWDKLLHIFKTHKAQMPPFVLFHRYSGNPGDIVRLADEYNAYFSYRDVDMVLLNATPRDRILIETDSNNPSHIVEIAHAFAMVCPDTDFHTNAQRMLNNG